MLPSKPPNEVASYRPISLLLIIEKMLLKRMKAHLSDITPNHQFGFRENHGTIEQVHRIVDADRWKTRNIAQPSFWTLARHLTRFGMRALLYKGKKMLPHSFYHIIKSYLSKRCFEVKFNDELSDLHVVINACDLYSHTGHVSTGYT
ncbi:unnamed protein product [Pieris macdunnoughi]|uniref:Reverse transcriptase n=1 Tax=Pieris macdunnoughi TaxID=345717 RepID=A0A821Y3N0_9NEOP|nr:unnamed protein product [Pieris macdunnoughi]